ncbi:MAG TPA: U32 family peptidase [Desulfobacteraceae bacterium]|nr:U32 family peptidase [Desulfobacteraceae bacterium]
MNKRNKPFILAPAGDKESFLAAVAAGADAVYCGLKIFSARMEADNFSIEQLSTLVTFARSRQVEVYVAFNAMIKENELEKTAKILAKLVRYVNPHALIVQDRAVMAIARRAGFKGEMHLSTLANASMATGLDAVKKAGFDRAVLPRELTIDEIKTMAAQAVPGLDLEVFIHGALCYAVSGRCYWSSWFGGKSGLRGRCVQPCRRVYRQNREKKRLFSCTDFSVDVLVKLLLDIPGITTWKIEGRKKSPHYVFYTVKAYQLLRDHGRDPQKKKTALAFLEYALGRPASHYHFLSHRRQNPLSQDAETGSGLFAGRVKIDGGQPCLVAREALLKGDLIRIGYEDDKGHAVVRVTRAVPKKGRLVLKNRKGTRLEKGSPVFVVDRKDPQVTAMIKELNKELEALEAPVVRPVAVTFDLSFTNAGKKKRGGKTRRAQTVTLSRTPPKGRRQGGIALWISRGEVERMVPKNVQNTWWWLPPVVWPGEQEETLALVVRQSLARGAKKFVLNMPWQISLFAGARGAELWAGPFCNTANSAAIAVLKQAGFSGAIVSPELGAEEFLSLPKNSPLPLGMVLQGNWPLAISRIVSDDILLDTPFSSPMGEKSWVTQRDGNYWVYPGWQLDLTAKQSELAKSGYTLFVHMEEKMPMAMKKREGLWNWKLSIL